jgi:hypothetical protein
MIARRAQANVGQLLGLSIAAFAASTMACPAGPCAPEIAAMEARLNANVAAIARSGPTAPESAGARLHHQPTPSSIAAAERELGEIPPEANQTITEAMAKAQKADQAGDKAACEQALEEVERTIPKTRQGLENDRVGRE